MKISRNLFEIFFITLTIGGGAVRFFANRGAVTPWKPIFARALDCYKKCETNCLSRCPANTISNCFTLNLIDVGRETVSL